MNPFWFGNPTSIGQQTVVGQMLTAGVRSSRSTGPMRRKRRGPKRAAARSVATRGVRRTRAKKARLVKGSAAAKAYMAKIRRKRRK